MVKIKHLLLGGLFVGLALLSLLTLWPTSLSITSSGGFLSIGVSAAPSEPIDLTAPSLDIKFEPSGTHLKDGYLKIRLDFYPKEGDKSYDQNHVYVVDETSAEYLAGYKGELDKDGSLIDIDDYNKWYDSLPHIWRVNPCLCHFITVPSDITTEELDAYIKTIFTGNITTTIDDIMSQLDSAHLISPYMRNKTGIATLPAYDIQDVKEEMYSKSILTYEELTASTPEAKAVVKIKVDNYIKNVIEPPIVGSVNAELANFVLSGENGGQIKEVEKGSIDVGPGAIDRYNSSSSGNTRVNKGNPSNADGILDTWELWFKTNGSGVDVATFYIVSGANYSTRDYETIGNVTAGSKQTFTGMSTDVHIGDYAGEHLTGGSIELDTDGGAGVWVASGDYIPCVNQAFTEAGAYFATSIYATGTESASFAISNTPDTINIGVVNDNSTYYAKGSAPSNPVDDSECTFTITNAGTTCDLDMNITDFTGGTTWNIVSGAPSTNEVRITSYWSGQNPASGLVLANTDAEFKDAFAAGTLKWDFKMETGDLAFEANQHTATITITAVAED